MFSGGWMVMVARASADWSQTLACNPDRLTNDELLHFLVYLPVRYLRRLALCLLSFLCLPDPYPVAAATRRRQFRVYYYYRSSSPSSSSDYSDEDDDSHSD